MDKFEINMNNLTDEEKEQFLELLAKAHYIEKGWSPEHDERYYTIDYDGIVKPFYNQEQEITNGAIAIGHCFRTEQDAEFALETLKVFAELNKFAKEHNKEYGLYILHYSYGNIDIRCESGYGVGCVRFDSPQTARAAVKEIGKERIIKYYFGIVGQAK